MRRFKKWFSVLGPGFITGASDDDPAGIGTYSQTGAMFGYSQTWTALFTFPLMSTIQEMCGRIGLVSGHGLSSLLKKNYPKPLLYFSVFLLVVANIINIGADLGAMAASAQLLVNLPFTFLLILFVVLTLGLQVFVPYRKYASYLKFLTFSLFAYIGVVFVITVDWKDVFTSTIIPSIEFSSAYIFNIVAIFGTTISPYLFFWQAGEEVEEEVKDNKLQRMNFGRPRVTVHDIRKLRADTYAGMFFSNLIMFFIIIATGATLHQNGITSIETANQAALALAPIAGDFASLLFTLGIVGTGLLAVPVLAGSMSYAVAEVFGWREGLSVDFAKARGFYGVIILSTLAGFLLNFIGINPISALYFSAVVNGIIAPFLIFLIIAIGNNKEIMGSKVNGVMSNTVGILTGILMSVFALLLIFSFLW